MTKNNIKTVSAFDQTKDKYNVCSILSLFFFNKNRSLLFWQILLVAYSSSIFISYYVPFYWDMAEYSDSAMDILSSGHIPPSRPFFPGLIALAFKFFGISAQSAMIPCVFFCILNPLLVFQLAKVVYGSKSAIVASTIYISSYPIVKYSYYYLDAILLFFVLSHLIIMIKIQKNEKQSFGKYFLASLFFTLGFLTKETAIAFIISSTFVMLNTKKDLGFLPKLQSTFILWLPFFLSIIAVKYIAYTRTAISEIEKSFLYMLQPKILIGVIESYTGAFWTDSGILLVINFLRRGFIDLFLFFFQYLPSQIGIGYLIWFTMPYILIKLIAKEITDREKYIFYPILLCIPLMVMVSYYDFRFRQVLPLVTLMILFSSNLIVLVFDKIFFRHSAKHKSQIIIFILALSLLPVTQWSHIKRDKPISLKNSRFWNWGNDNRVVLDWKGRFSPGDRAVRDFIDWIQKETHRKEKFISNWGDMSRTFKLLTKGSFHFDYLRMRSFSDSSLTGNVSLMFHSRKPWHRKSKIYVIEKKELKRIVDEKYDYFILSDDVNWCNQFFKKNKGLHLIKSFGNGKIKIFKIDLDQFEISNKIFTTRDTLWFVGVWKNRFKRKYTFFKKRLFVEKLSLSEADISSLAIGKSVSQLTILE